jgi:sugar-phosphatase
VDSRAVVERIWRHWAAERGLDAERFLRVAHGRRIRETLRAVDPALDTEREVRALDAAETAAVDAMSAIAGARELVSGLAPDTWGIVTSGGRALARRRLDLAGLPHPAVFVTGEDVTNGKPAPEGYLLAARRLGREAASCIVFEDAPPGLEAARAAGARVVALTTTHAREDLPGAERTIADFTSVRVSRDGAELIVRFDA